jgi:type II secretory ATPase GspE/PulE/Tfp pilus assembly ATPase PilB-like protein
MGIEHYLLSSTIVTVCAQRLLRWLCSHCKEAYAPSTEDKYLAGLGPGQDAIFHRAKGCPSCAGTGYKGRSAIFDILALDDNLKAKVSVGRAARELKPIYDAIIERRRR